MPQVSAKNSEKDLNNEKEDILFEDSWAIRPCFLYKEEYADCRSIKGRFHQYFIHGESIDCKQWKCDYDNCIKYEDKKDIAAGRELIKSETNRRQERLKSHYANDIWKKRTVPPEDWNKPLPDILAKKNENTFLEIKSKELLNPNDENSSSVLLAAEKYCCIM